MFRIGNASSGRAAAASESTTTAIASRFLLHSLARAFLRSRLLNWSHLPSLELPLGSRVLQFLQQSC
jgi:hypothetical protein